MLPPTARAAAVLLLLAAGAGVPTPAAAAQREPPADTRATWTVGITAFRGEGLDPADAWLAWSVPLLLRDQLAGLDTHTLDADGRAALARAAIARDRQTLLASLDGLRNARDAAAFGETRPAAPGSPAAPDALSEAMDRLAWLDGLDASAVEVPDVKPLSIKDGEGPGLLLATPFGSRGEACSREDVDLLIGGSVREEFGYFLVDVWAWDAARGEAVFTWRDAATRGELYERVAEAGRGLTGVLLGRPWASLVVTVQPPQASLLVDGESPGTGRSRFDDLAPGAHELRVKAPGYRDEARTVELAAGTETSLALALETMNLGTIAVASDPSGADALLDAVWQGRTPLDIPRPGERARLVVSLPDGPEVALTVGPTSPGQLSISLAHDVVRPEAERAAARDRFYGSFGWLVLSLPVPLYTYSWAVDWAAEARALTGAGDTAGAARAADFSYGFYYAYLGGLGISVALAGWTVYNIVRYVRAADRSAGPGVAP
jgi:hypothetical protein